MRKRVISLAVVIFSYQAIASPDTAYAYLDPGSGSILLQGLLASFAAVTAGAGYYWRSLAGIFRRKRPQRGAAGERQHDGR
jgi:hypothetical protein